MRCEDFVRRLTEYGDEALPGELCGEIERHLRECAPCDEVRRDLEDLRRLCRQAAAAGPPRIPVELRTRLEALLRKS